MRWGALQLLEEIRGARARGAAVLRSTEQPAEHAREAQLLVIRRRREERVWLRTLADVPHLHPAILVRGSREHVQPIVHPDRHRPVLRIVGGDAPLVRGAPVHALRTLARTR